MATHSTTIWPSKKIGEVATVVPGYAFKSKDWRKEGIPVIKIKNIVGDLSVDTKDVDCVPETMMSDKLGKFCLEDGDILVAMTGATAGKVGRLRCKRTHLLNQRVARLVPFAIDRLFFWAVVSSNDYQNRFFKLADGAAQPNMSGSQIEQVDIPAPSRMAQRKIASILSAYDDLIENNTRRIAILEAMAQTIYREWFVELRFPGHEKVKLVDSPSGKIPDGWELRPLKRITTKIGSGATPRGGKEAYKSNGITLIRSLNIYDNQFEHKNLAFIDEEQAEQLDNVTVHKRDILLNITGASVARCCMVPSYLLPARVNQHVAIIRVDTSCADPFYLLTTINSERHKRHILALAQGGATREALTKDTISNYEVALPSKAVLSHYAGVVADIFDERELLERKNNCLRKTRDLLLPKLISGQLDVEDLDIETAHD